MKKGQKPKKKYYTCYTIVRKKNGYFSLVKLTAKDYEIIKDAQETTQVQVFRQIDKEFHTMILQLLKPENKNDDGTSSF